VIDPGPAGRVALVTGANQSIGAAAARTLAGPAVLIADVCTMVGTTDSRCRCET
jgi:NAD(P)-dependent dehydrogenase (short-subunit alcohol dehydrogenase family)